MRTPKALFSDNDLNVKLVFKENQAEVQKLQDKESETSHVIFEICDRTDPEEGFRLGLWLKLRVKSPNGSCFLCSPLFQRMDQDGSNGENTSHTPSSV